MGIRAVRTLLVLDFLLDMGQEQADLHMFISQMSIPMCRCIKNRPARSRCNYYSRRLLVEIEVSHLKSLPLSNTAQQSVQYAKLLYTKYLLMSLLRPLLIIVWMANIGSYLIPARLREISNPLVQR